MHGDRHLVEDGALATALFADMLGAAAFLEALQHLALARGVLESHAPGIHLGVAAIEGDAASSSLARSSLRSLSARTRSSLNVKGRSTARVIDAGSGS
jgi:hypothetical protein